MTYLIKLSEAEAALRRWSVSINAFRRQVTEKMFPLPFSSIQTIFFDAGFTLFSSSIPHICQQICRDYGLVVDLEQIQSATRQTADYYQRSIQQQSIWEQEETIQTMWIDYYQYLFPFFLVQCGSDVKSHLAYAIYHTSELPTSWQVYSDVLPVLKRLKAAGYQVGVISNWGRSLFSILSYHDLILYIDCLIVSALVHQAKPSPRIFEIALQETHTRAEEALYIGDNYMHDVLGARAAGIFPILIDRSANPAPITMDCQVIHSLSDLLGLVKIDQLVETMNLE